ncbi:MAG: ABC transporter permease [Deltaproteobacteria bacterium]|nr:ABC transporter permease [Deltaproteobacteria bacterium]
METFSLYTILGLRNIWRHPRRSLLTFLAIILGLMLFILTRGIQIGTYEKIIEKGVRTSTGYIQIHKTGYRENHSFEYIIENADKVFQVLAQESRIAVFSPRITGEALVASDEGTTGAAVMGVDTEREFEVTTLSSRMKKGDLPRGKGDIIIGERLAKNLKVAPGDELILIANGADGSLGADRFTLSGIFATGVADFDSSVVLIGIEDADLLYSMYGAITEIVIHLKAFDFAESTAKKLSLSLGGMGMEVHSWKELLPEMVQMISLDNIGGLVMLWFFFIVVIAVILNTILISTLERIKEFGIMMSLGLKPSRVFFMILYEAAILVSIGTVIGLIFSWLAGSYLEANPFSISETVSKNMEAQGFSPLIYTKLTAGIIFSWGAGIFLASIFAALYPAQKVARMSPLKALHPGRGEM